MKGIFFISLLAELLIVMEPLRISVVIPTYKRPALLLRCLQSLTRQDFPGEHYEIIVVSDGEDPVTASALSDMQAQRFPLIRYYALARKGGPAAARNLGWILAQSQLIAFTDDDCMPDQKWLAAIWSSWHRSGQCAEVAYSGNTIVPIGPEPTDYEKNISRLAFAEFITANCACTVAALRKVGGFDERFTMAWREDSDLQFKFIQDNIPILRISDAVVTHPVRKAPWGISIRDERKNMFNALLYKKYPSLYRQKIQPNPPWHYYIIAVFLVVLVIGLLTGRTPLQVVGIAGWAAMTAWFAARRLRAASRSWNHVSEMIFTSAIIPLLSLFWKFYGSWKYRVLLIP